MNNFFSGKNIFEFKKYEYKSEDNCFLTILYKNYWN